MSREVQDLKEKMKAKSVKDENAAELQQNEQLYELRRENFRLAADVRRLQLDNELLRSDERGKKEEVTFHEIAKLENQVEDLKSEKAHSERENAKLLAKIRQMDAQLVSIKQERDRLLELSSDLKIQIAQSEKSKFMPNRSGAHTEIGQFDEDSKGAPPQLQDT